MQEFKYQTIYKPVFAGYISLQDAKTMTDDEFVELHEMISRHQRKHQG